MTTPHDQNPKGSLVLIGGACSAEGDALATFVRMSGADQGGRIVGLTTASMDPVGSAMAWKETFTMAGAAHTEFPIVDRRARAQDRSVADMILDAPGIFLGGGDQVHLVSTIGGSLVWEAIVQAYGNGAVVCGTSAGAAALTEVILAGGEPDEHGKVRDMYIGPGFGLLGFHAMIDTHFAQRRRLHRLFVAISQNPQFMGLGLDEDTALVVQGELGAVVGRGGVTFVDGCSIRYDNTDDVKLGAYLTLSHLRVGVVGNGHVFNLRARELEVLVRGERAEEEVPTVK
ncbi:MAG TPA: cyanophycinase [Gemmatimonadaceae bacterium]|nr:cyanophycinase [Gemmatimonadaceae bacterium]